jgi:hypothetical protein
MSMDISLYTFEDIDGEEDVFSTFNSKVAKEYAQKYNLRVIENIFEWSECIPVENCDFTGGRK